MGKAEQEIKNADDFLRGQSDCKDGIPHKPNMSDDYDRGYSAQYELEQLLMAKS